MTTTVGDLNYQLDNINFTAKVLGLVDVNKTEINIPATITVNPNTYTVKSIGNDAFYNNIKLKKVTFDVDSELETIGENAFNHISIESIVIPKTVNTIGSFAFVNCRKLKSVIFEVNSQLETIGEGAFNRILIVSIVIPNKVKTIGIDAFSNNFVLRSVKFEGDIPTIGSGAFTDISSFIPALGQVDEKTYPNWEGVNKIDNLYINKKEYTNKVLLRLLPLIALLILLLVNGYYFIISHSLLTNMLVIMPLTLLIIVLIPLGIILNRVPMYLVGGGCPTSILSLALIIGTLVKSKWSLLYRLPMSILLLASTIGGWFGLFL